jgi:hypothetical protein
MYTVRLETISVLHRAKGGKGVADVIYALKIAAKTPGAVVAENQSAPFAEFRPWMIPRLQCGRGA